MKNLRKSAESEGKNMNQHDCNKCPYKNTVCFSKIFAVETTVIPDEPQDPECKNCMYYKMAINNKRIDERFYNTVQKQLVTDNNGIGVTVSEEENKTNSVYTDMKTNTVKPKNDSVNHPSHYTDGKIEVIDFIEDKNLDFHRANAIKYICRAGKKYKDKEIEDIEKAIWYLNRYIQTLKNAKQQKE